MRHPMAVYFLQQSTKFDCHRTTAVARTTKRHDQIEDGPGCGGWVNMNDIVARVLDCTEYAADESSFLMADKMLRTLASDISRRQWCIRRIKQSFRFVVGAERDGECLGVAMSPKGSLGPFGEPSGDFNRRVECADKRTMPSAMCGRHSIQLVGLRRSLVRVLLFFAYGSIVVATAGWFASTRHAVGMGVLALPGESRAIFPDKR